MQPSLEHSRPNYIYTVRGMTVNVAMLAEGSLSVLEP